METYTVSIEATYRMTKQVKAEYLAWLDDYKDTEEMRKSFFEDRFIHPEFWAYIIETPYLLDYRNAKLKIRKGK